MIGKATLKTVQFPLCFSCEYSKNRARVDKRS